MQKFVTTKAEYQWHQKRGEYILESKQGYWYDGDWAIAIAPGGAAAALPSAPTPPTPPDPFAIAQAEAEFNRIDQITPFGSLTFSGPNRNTATQTLSPELQGLLDQRLQSDSALLGSALERQQLLQNQPIDLSQFGPIQSQIDTSGINFQGPQFGGLPQLTAPDLQGVGQAPGLQSQVGSPFDIQGQVDLGLDTSALPGIPQDIGQFRGDVERSVFERGRALLDPVFADQQRALDQRLANQGLPRSGEAVEREQTRFGDIRSRAFTDLANQATITGGQEASRSLGDILAARGQGFGEQVTGAGLGLAGGQFANLAAGQGFGQNLAAGQFGNIAQQQGFQNQLAGAGFNNQVGLLGLGAQQGIRGQLTGEQLAQAQGQNQASALNLGLQQQLLQNQNAGRSQGLAEAQGIRGNQFNELASLLGLQQVQAPQLSSFFSPGQANVTGAFGLNQQAQQNAFQAETSQRNALLSGLFGLGAAGVTAFSDRRLKTNIKRIGKKNGHKWYSFDYIWGQKGEGVLADEVPDRFVTTNGSGYEMVNYGALLNVG